MARARIAASAGLMLAVALAVAPLLSACSDTSLLANPATGETITGSAYSFTAPQGWHEPDAATRAPGVDAEIVNGAAGTAFTDKMIVILSPTGVLTPDQVESDGVTELTNAGARDVTVDQRVTVAGSESAHLTYTILTNTDSFVSDQYYLTHDGQTFVVAFSFDPDTSQDARDDLAGSVLVTWKWS